MPEADENVVKVTKAATNRSNILVFSGAFHGRTYLTMTMTSKKAYAVKMGPLAGGVYRAQFPYYYRNPEGMPQEKALDYYVKSIYDVFEECAAADTFAAVVVEPLQGEGGFIPAPLEWVKALREICDEYGILLIADEVQSGFCRTGRMFASEYWAEVGVQPDLIATAKSIAAGIPLSAIVASAEIMDRVAPGSIGGTYCGNPLACAAALTKEIISLCASKGLLVEGAAFAREHQCEVIVAIGGGSIMDCAKAIAFLAVNDGDINNYIYGRETSERALPLVLIPTTCGTGSKGNGFAVLTNPQNGDCTAIYGCTLPVCDGVDRWQSVQTVSGSRGA